MIPPVHPALKRFLWDIQSMVELTDDPREILFIGSDLMGRLLASDDWLPEAFGAGAPDGPRQYQLYADDAERFCVVASVLGAGQALPLFDKPFWQLMGVLRGTPTLRKLALAEGAARASDGGRLLARGAVERLSPRAGEAFQLSNTGTEGAIAIQVYGAEIKDCPRHALTPDGHLQQTAFGYANAPDDPPYDIWSIQTKIED